MRTGTRTYRRRTFLTGTGTGCRHWWRRCGVSAALAVALTSGCLNKRAALHYLGEPEHREHRQHVTEIDYPDVDLPHPDEVTSTAPPRTVRDHEHQPIRDITLAEAVHIALSNSHVIRTGGAFLTPGNALLANPEGVPSIYDPAIQETGVLFGRLGTEAALSAFDAQLNASMIWGRDEQIQNNPFFGGGIAGGAALESNVAQFNAGLRKAFAHGGAVSLNHVVNYQRTNIPPNNLLFQSAYTGNLELQYQLPLLAGAGTEYTRIAGPIGQAFGGLTGVSQGVLIARINNDITLADFELAIHNLVRDIEDAYWDLYLAYRNYHTAVTAKESSLLTWRIADIQLQGGVRTRAEVAQARDQYFATEAASNNARSEIFSAEIRLRRLMGLPANDGETLRPAEEPVSAELVPEWYASLSQAMTRRVELRRQKWNIKSLELQMRAAESLTKPRMDFIGAYRLNGFGDHLIGHNRPPLDNFYQQITRGDESGWNLGLQANWPIGFRSARAQVRNFEFRLAKAQKVLLEQEEEVSHELAVAFQELTRAYQAAELNMNRLIAARENVKYLEPNIREGDMLLDELLRAQLRQAEAEVAYYQSLVDYNKSLTNLQFRKGTLLDHNSVHLLEGGWHPDAYIDSGRQHQARAHARESHLLEAVPEPFSVDSPVGGIYFTNPAALPNEPTPAEPAP